jgi:putative FmdB family regulatory protein
MPLYEYECEACHNRFERIQKFSDPPVETCPTCGKGPVRKLISSPAIQFKGSGWYITDYAKKSSSDAGSTGGSGGDKKEKKAEKGDTGDSTAKTDAPSTGTNSSTKSET